MEGWFDFEHPHIISYITDKALMAYEKALGSQNEVNQKAIHKQLKWGREYVFTHGRSLIPRGIYTFSTTPHFTPKELKDNRILCELVFLLTQRDNQEEELLPILRNSFMDGARQYIRSQMLPSLYKLKAGVGLNYVSPYFGPGLFSIPIKEIHEYYSFLKVKPDLAILKGHMLDPLSSFIGGIYGLEENTIISPCANCHSHANCQFCLIDK